MAGQDGEGDEDEVVLVSSSGVLKGVSNVVRLAQHAEEFEAGGPTTHAPAPSTPTPRPLTRWLAGGRWQRLPGRGPGLRA